MKNKILNICFFVFCTFLCVIDVKAAECTDKELKELKELAKKVEISYEFNEKVGAFNLYVYNLNEKIIIDDFSEIYNKNKSFVGQLFPGSSYRYYITASDKTNCNEEVLRTIRIKAPSYNQYYNSDICKQYSDSVLCQKWYNINRMTLEEFTEKLKSSEQKEVKKKKTFLEVIKENKNIILISFSSVVGIVVVILVYKKFKKKKIDI